MLVERGLSPPMFKIYVNDIVNSSNTLSFGDDTRLISTIQSFNK